MIFACALFGSSAANRCWSVGACTRKPTIRCREAWALHSRTLSQPYGEPTLQLHFVLVQFRLPAHKGRNPTGTHRESVMGMASTMEGSCTNRIRIRKSTERSSRDLRCGLMTRSRSRAFSYELPEMVMPLGVMSCRRVAVVADVTERELPLTTPLSQ